MKPVENTIPDADSEVVDPEVLGVEGKKTQAKVYGQLTFLLNDYMREKRRNDELILFADRSDGTNRKRTRSSVKYMDKPETELLLNHIHRIEKIDKQCALFESVLEKPEQSPVVMVEAGQLISKLNAQRQYHLTQVSNILENKRRRQTKQEEMITAIVQNRLKLAQDEAHHRDKLHLQEQRSKEEDLVSKLCKTYNITREKVYAEILRRPDPQAIEHDAAE